jgi:predicted phage terminase large subunit-like protein
MRRQAPPPADVVRQLAAVKAEQARRSLHRFFRDYAWPVLQPAAPFMDNWHVGAICEHLEAVTNGQIKRLIISMPYRMLKSSIVSQAWPAWEWATYPHYQYFSASYAMDVATRDAVDSRRIIESPRYQAAWGDRFAMTGDQNVKTRYENDKRGSRIVAATEAKGTGMGGGRIIIDDPVSAREADSETSRTNSIEFYRGTASTRMNSPKDDAMVITHQRLNRNDLTGYILAEEKGWEHLVLPMRYSAELCKTTSLGFVDPRKVEGELLHPERLPEATVREMEVRLGTYHANAQLQQNPDKREGSLIKLEWFQRYHDIPSAPSNVVLSLDCAQKTKELNDYTAMGVWFVKERKAYLVHVWREKVEYPELKRKFLDFYALYRPQTALIEDKGHGTALLQELRAAGGYPVTAIEPHGDKPMRMSAETALIEAGSVFLPVKAGWLGKFETEVMEFPSAPHDDQVDMLSQFLAWYRVTIIGGSGFAAGGQSGIAEISLNRMNFNGYQ